VGGIYAAACVLKILPCRKAIERKEHTIHLSPIHSLNTPAMSQAKPGYDGTPDGVDIASFPTAQKLAARSLEFLQEIKDL
jgi:hypothetical protein